MTDTRPPQGTDPTWERELASAFEVLLGKPLDVFPTRAQYPFFTSVDTLHYELFDDLVSGELDLAAIAAGETVSGRRYEEADYPCSIGWYDFDLHWSIFLVSEDAFEEDGPLGGTIATALLAVSTAAAEARAVGGADLARVLLAHADRRDEIDAGEVEVEALIRVRTDGTLFDAMRAATWTSSPDHLAPFDPQVEVEPDQDRALRRISHPGLRDHLRMLCLTPHYARSGVRYLADHWCPSDLEWIGDQPGHTLIAGWDFGEGQASAGVFQLG